MKLFARLGGEQLFFEQFDGGRSRFADDLRAVAFGMAVVRRGELTAIHTEPTGYSGVPPVGPAIPVVAIA